MLVLQCSCHRHFIPFYTHSKYYMTFWRNFSWKKKLINSFLPSSVVQVQPKTEIVILKRYGSMLERKQIFWKWILEAFQRTWRKFITPNSINLKYWKKNRDYETKSTLHFLHTFLQFSTIVILAIFKNSNFYFPAINFWKVKDDYGRKFAEIL